MPKPYGMFFDNWSINDSAPYLQPNTLAGIEDVTKIIPVAAIGAGAYHGYKRTGSAGWAVAYAALAGLSPLITGAIMVAQGFGKRK